MTFTQLRCFIEVARQLNFARAAETLYISQPAVSRQIHALENELGVRLFDRTRHVVALTSAGESFYHDTVDMLDRLTLAVQRAEHAGPVQRRAACRLQRQYADPETAADLPAVPEALPAGAYPQRGALRAAVVPLL